MGTVYIIIVNWNGWQDTIECLESVLRINYPDYRVLVCDNGSTDDSKSRIAAWAAGQQLAGCRNVLLKRLSDPPLPKPIPCYEFQPEGSGQAPASWKLGLISTGSNLGFAGATNVGLRMGLLLGDMDYAWLLNNDTVVEPDALVTMIRRIRANPHAGMCGSTLLYYHAPHLVQALGGSAYNRWTARSRHIGKGIDASAAPTTSVEPNMDYVVGASMLVSRQFVENVGLMAESYFLYFEEIDWTSRANGRFELCYAPDSIVYHKEGGSTGSDSRFGTQSAFVDYYATRNRLAFTRKHEIFALPTVVMAIGLSALMRLLAGRFCNAWMVLRAVFDQASHPARIAGEHSKGCGRGLG